MPDVTPCPLCAVNYETAEKVAYHLRDLHRWTENDAIRWLVRYLKEEAAA